jgi:hypothetical protein
MLAEVAEAGMVEDSRAPDFGSHPLSAFRMNTEGPEAISRLATDCLALVATVAISSEIDSLVAVLVRASRAPFAASRAIAARALRGKLETIPVQPEIAVLLQAHTAVRGRLLELTRDPDETVRLAAYETLFSDAA